MPGENGCSGHVVREIPLPLSLCLPSTNIMSCLKTARSATPSAASASLYEQAFAQLADVETNDYLGNLLNSRILTPSDENFR